MTEDINEIAARVTGKTTDEEEAAELQELVAKAVREGKNPAAVLLGQKGGKKGGKARAKVLGAERRSEIAKKAAEARWKKS